MSGSSMPGRYFYAIFFTRFFRTAGYALPCTVLAARELYAPRPVWMVACAVAVLVAPAILFSGVGGELADCRNKAGLIKALRQIDVLVAASAAFALVAGNLLALFGAVAASCIVAALAGPADFTILPDHLESAQLPRANALLDGGTLAAVLVGAAGSSLVMARPGGMILIAVAVLVAAILSWCSASKIPSTPSPLSRQEARIGVITSSRRVLRDLFSDLRFWPVALANTWFWLLGTIALTLMPGILRDRFGANTMQVGLSLGLLAAGVATGYGLAAFLAGGRIILAITSIGCAMLGVALVGFWLLIVVPLPSPLVFVLAICSLLVLVGIGAGLIATSTRTAIQARSAPDHRARVVAAANTLSSLGILCSGGILLGCRAGGFDQPALLGFAGLLSIGLAALMLLRLPSNPVGEALWVLYRILFRIEAHGLQNLPRPGQAALITPNHTSWLDAGLIVAIVEERLLFAVDTQSAKLWWVRPALTLVSWLPVESAGPQSLRKMITAVSAGRMMVIFPEGRLTITGSLMEVLPGTGTVADKAQAVIVPVHHQGLERTPFSRHTRAQTRRALFPKVTVTVYPGRSLQVPDDLVGRARRLALTAALRNAMEESVYLSRLCDDTLFQAIARSGRRHGMSRMAVQDPVSGILSYRKLLAGADVLGGKISIDIHSNEMVGLLLPTSNAAAVCLLGLQSYGHTVAILNATAGLLGLRAAIQAAEVRTVVTSRAFMEKARLGPTVDQLRDDVRVLFLEDIRPTITRLHRMKGLLRATYRTTTPRLARKADDQAVIVFTSGSSGTPKGVALSHRNLLSNIAQVAGRIGFGPDDRVLNALPIFHAFGLTGGFLLPLTSGIPVFLYPSPLHYSTVPVVAYDWKATAIFGTSVFFNGYARRAIPTAFRSLRLVIAGAARVAPAIHEVWMEKFGLRILEGYGVTECSPVVAVNTPVSNRSGTVGRLLPGMQMRLDALPGREDGGRLVVRGPNVMLGYLRSDMPGVLQPPEDGWYDTGDIVSVDNAQHLRIHGRLTRTARLGGEMISLEAIENIAADLWPDAMSVAVAIPDPRKDERIILLTDKTGADRKDFVTRARALGASEVMLPAKVEVMSKLPMLGTGKPDYMMATKLMLAAHHVQEDGT